MRVGVGVGVGPMEFKLSAVRRAATSSVRGGGTQEFEFAWKSPGQSES